MRYLNSSQWRFLLTDRVKIKAYFAILIYIGIHKIKDPQEYWANLVIGLPILQMKWYRYEHLKSIIKVSDIDKDDKYADVPGD